MGTSSCCLQTQKHTSHESLQYSYRDSTQGAQRRAKAQPKNDCSMSQSCKVLARSHFLPGSGWRPTLSRAPAIGCRLEKVPGATCVSTSVISQSVIWLPKSLPKPLKIHPHLLSVFACTDCRSNCCFTSRIPTNCPCTVSPLLQKRGDV